MRKAAAAVAACALMCAAAWSLDARDYRALFAAEYSAAEDMAAELESLVAAALDGDEELARVALAVVFPELTRYSYIRDVAETSALELSYALGGGADFSIGKLQMKPSFAEAMERLRGEELERRFPRLSERGASDQATRGLRLRRLKSDEAQAEYLAVFMRVMLSRFPGIPPRGAEAVRIFATAYNSGYNRSLDELEARASQASFPYGRSYEGEQFSYAEIALMRYAGTVR